MAVALALTAFAIQQAIERTRQAQQLSRVLLGQAVALSRFDLIQLGAELAQAAKPHGQPKPQKPQQHDEGATQPDIQLLDEPLVHGLVVAPGLHGDHAERRAPATQQIDLDVIDEVDLSLVIGLLQKELLLSVIARHVLRPLPQRGARLPDQLAFTVVDKAQLAGGKVVVLLVGQFIWHIQMAILDARRGDQRTGVGSETQVDRVIQGNDEGATHRRHQCQHEQHRQHGGPEHEAQPQGNPAVPESSQSSQAVDHRQRSVNR
ncbi:hypothetical protein D3C84_216250 [compost metagenome]